MKAHCAGELSARTMLRPPECLIVPPRTPLLFRTTKGRSESAHASINSSQCCFTSCCTRGRYFDDAHSFPTSRSLWDSAEEISEMGRSLTTSSSANMLTASAPACRLPSWKEKLGSNLGPTTAKLDPKPCTMTQNKVRRTNKIFFCNFLGRRRPPVQIRTPRPFLPFPGSFSIRAEIETAVIGNTLNFASFQGALRIHQRTFPTICHFRSLSTGTGA
jgi:hypothetical protein